MKVAVGPDYAQGLVGGPCRFRSFRPLSGCPAAALMAGIGRLVGSGWVPTYFFWVGADDRPRITGEGFAGLSIRNKFFIRDLKNR